MLKLTIPVLMACVAASAQTPPATLEALAAAQYHATPLWVAVDDAKGTFVKALQAALEEDGPLELDLPLQVLSAKTHPALLKELATRHGWNGPRWALVDAKGTLLTQGAKPPSADELMAAAQGVGLRPRTQVMEAFLQAHPDHVEAMEELLGTYLRVATRRMERHLNPRTGEAPKNDSEDRGRTLKQPLTEAEDARIWGRSAKLLERMFLENLIHLNGQPIASLPEVAALSPLMREAARKALPVLETWIERDPRRWTFWMMWRSLDRWTGHTRSARRLLERAQPIPGRPRFIQGDAVRAFNREAVASQDWQGLVGFLQPLWEKEVDQGMGGKVDEASENGAWYVAHYWDQFGPLIEAHLRLGDERRAGLVVEEMIDLTGYRSLARNAAGIATTLKRPDLATRWGGLTGKKKDEPAVVEMGRK